MKDPPRFVKGVGDSFRAAANTLGNRRRLDLKRHLSISNHAANYNDDSLSATFHALANPTRRAIPARLAESEAKMGALAEPFAMSLPAISKHLKVLENAGLIRHTVDGRVHHRRPAPEPLDDATGWIRERREFWQKTFNQLAR
ncbi:MAG: winged helix-turn-helix transcriptional regulator [Rhodospirillales bacterium]|nr:winged helix-turn-helix transcriptional regulator [Rhodospirillales bacterium]